MDDEAYFKFLLFLVVIGGGILLSAGIKANNGKPYWATKCLLFGGAGLFFFFGVIFLVAIAEPRSSLEEGGMILLGGLFLLTLLVFLVGAFSLCARFGATCRRATQLEEVASALAAAESAELAQEKESRIE